ncbi:MAG: cytochrome P450 [Sphingobium sp.]
MNLVSANPSFRMADAVPDHVPVDRIFAYDIYAHDAPGGDFAATRFELREAGAPRVFWTPYNGGHWVATRASEIDVVVNDAKLFGSNYVRVPKEEIADPPMLPLQADPPFQMKYRNLLMGALSPGNVKKLGEKARELTIDLIDGFIDDGECDFVQQYARVMPIGIYMLIVDYPMEDRTMLIGVVEKVLRGKSPAERREGFEEARTYIRKQIARREAQPGEDLISHLVQAEKDGTITRKELEGMMLLLFTAGIDTVAAMLSGFARFLALNPDHRRQLIDDPALIPNAVEELLRRFSIVYLTRVARMDIEMDGVTIKEGDMIVAPTPLGNLDEDKAADPMTVDFHRKPSPNSSFGGQAHRCMGSMLARTEIRIFIEEWLRRIPNFDIKPGTQVVASADITSIIPELRLVWNT